MSTLLDTVEIVTGPNVVGTIIWMHGFGADAHDFEPIVPELDLPPERPLRFVFPNAPVRRITIYGGQAARAWFDIAAFNTKAEPDHLGIRESGAAIGALIERENRRGIPTHRIALAGFSQGGAIAVFAGLRYPERLAGVMGLSCFSILESTLEAERQVANQATPILLAHGTQDPMVNIQRGLEMRTMLESLGYPVTWREYPIPHSVCSEEIRDISTWLKSVLP